VEGCAVDQRPHPIDAGQGEDLAGVGEQGVAGRHEAHAPGGPAEERDAQLVLQALDAAGEGRLRDAEATRGPAQVLLLGHRDERLQLQQGHHQGISRGAAASDAFLVLVPARALPHKRVVGVVIHGPEEIERARRAGRVAAQTLAAVVAKLRAGITTAQIDRWVRADTAARGARPSQLGYQGFPAAVCTSRNHVVCHGMPSEAERLEAGDIINVDVTSELGGFHGDTSATVAIGTPAPEAAHVLEVARHCRDAGVAAVRDGARLGDIGAAIEEVAHAAGCAVVSEWGGHGIGRAMHMEPHVAYVGPPGRGLRLRAGMMFTVEPMITIGRPGVRTLDDGWTVVTADGSPSAQFEHTVLVTASGGEVLTTLPEGLAP
jgi:methionyl aminopeptidase